MASSRGNGMKSWPVLPGLALSLLSAGLLILSFPPYNLHHLVWIALVPMIVAQYRVATRVWQANLFQAVTFFIFIDITVLASFPRMNLGWGSVRLWITVAALVAALLLFVTGLPGGSPTFHRRSRFRYFLVFPVVCWVGFEYLRYLLDLGQMWGMFFIPQHRNLCLLQLASVFGMWIVSAIVVFTNYAVGLLVIGAPATGENRRPGRRTVAVVLLTVLLAAHLGGWLMLRRDRPTTDTVQVAAVQPGRNFRHKAYWSRDRLKVTLAILSDLEAMTGDAAARGAELVVWPEASLWVNPLPRPDILDRLVKLAVDHGIYLLVPWFDHSDHENVLNETLAIAPDGTILGRCAKNHPIEFAGYLDGSATRGAFPTWATPFGPFGSMIGYDADFTDVARKLTRNGARLVAVSMHDRGPFWYNQLAHTIYRAAENRVAIVRSDWRYASCVIDQHGRIVAGPAGSEANDIVMMNVALTQSGTIYTKIGDIFAMLSLAGMVVFLLCDTAVRLWGDAARGTG
jgi:apolipoprotein N-acyltransferase